ncbi:unnamed protein product [Ixodes hexagonus]
MASNSNGTKKRKLGARVTARQFELLLDYMSAHPALVRAATNSPMSQLERNALWDTVVEELNAHGPAVKTRAEWKSFWNPRVCKARARDRDLSCATGQTGGGVNPVPPLNAEEEKILALVGRDSSQGCGGRRLAPTAAAAVSVLNDPPPADTDASQDTPEVGAPAQVAPMPQLHAVQQPPGTKPPRTVRARSGPEGTARDLLATQQEQLTAQLELLATQQGLLATQQQQLVVQQDILQLQRGAAAALDRLTSVSVLNSPYLIICLQAVEGLAAASAQQSSSLTTLVLHLMGVRNLVPHK